MGVFVLWGFSLFLILIQLIAVIWVIYDVVTKQQRMPDTEKIIWIIVAIFLGLIGAIVYYFVVKASGKYEGREEILEQKDDVKVW
ncbi:PLDc N-terminal domain-containing protein [Thermococcus sp. AM4]|uniref:PLDc N-terminal domain-containing protein n=1 Tax=Thermococcus sp. (strain AM4) TaxID=246969 RepID=UPI000187134A|nr:PLDc N-terminal domain-containing protein [Thermococcus sp. AM4]EEB73954.1 conserved hypothetical protein [Thermococcus sp. AM4]